jgi:hypothetical protein
LGARGILPAFGGFMRAYRNILLAGICALALALLAWAQAPKAGLYEVNSNMTWQQSPLPPGVQAPAGRSPFGGGPHTTQTCVTQSQIDKYNGLKPDTHGGCQVTNISKHENGMTAEIVCSGAMSGKGTVDSSWTDSGHSKSRIHFTGEIQMGQNSKTIEWTVDSEATYKGPDCGSVKPAAE